MAVDIAGTTGLFPFLFHGTHITGVPLLHLLPVVRVPIMAVLAVRLRALDPEKAVAVVAPAVSAEVAAAVAVALAVSVAAVSAAALAAAWATVAVASAAVAVAADNQIAFCLKPKL